VQREVLDVYRVEDEIAAERHALAKQAHHARHRLASGCELALFVEFTVVRQVRLGNDPQNPTSIDRDAAVEELALESEWGPDQEDGRERTACIANERERSLDGVEDRVLMKEVVAGVGGKPEFGEKRYSGALFRCLPCERECALRILRRIGDVDVRNADRDANESM